ncbi:4-hydroxy-tetrahydrodipicolinate reductase [hydrothermal vent metagenome]|uniref:4-hydroxy-tetrahydrodipicolinate reductase n=1 Tax=hydrothermal vent metagenome TaxID=652676 RepID=A0A3B0RKN1_9ZZZZ
MIKVAITGLGGRMGRQIAAAVDENPQTELAGALEKAGSEYVGKDAALIVGGGSTGIMVQDEPGAAFKEADVIIDFSATEASMEFLKQASELGKAVVIGTTGFSPHHKEIIQGYAKTTRIVLAPNMSIGVNLLFKLVSDAAVALGDDYDIEIVESHHKHKVDAPSGTGLRLAEVAAHALGRDLEKVGVFERNGIIGERKKGEIGVQSLRGGDIVGDHTVMFAGAGERIELIHRAHSRSTFASGAVRAAVWLVGKPEGLYDMQDVLGLK